MDAAFPFGSGNVLGGGAASKPAGLGTSTSNIGALSFWPLAHADRSLCRHRCSHRCRRLCLYMYVLAREPCQRLPSSWVFARGSMRIKCIQCRSPIEHFCGSSCTGSCSARCAQWGQRVERGRRACGWGGAGKGHRKGHFGVFAAADSLLGAAEVCWDALTGKAEHGYCGGDRG
jgi:hypothetical protein